MGLGPAMVLGNGASQGPMVHPRNKAENLVLEFKVYHIVRFILEPDPWGWGQPRPLGLGQPGPKGASHE